MAEHLLRNTRSLDRTVPARISRRDVLSSFGLSAAATASIFFNLRQALPVGGALHPPWRDISASRLIQHRCRRRRSSLPCLYFAIPLDTVLSGAMLLGNLLIYSADRNDPGKASCRLTTSYGLRSFLTTLKHGRAFSCALRCKV